MMAGNKNSGRRPRRSAIHDGTGDIDFAAARRLLEEPIEFSLRGPRKCEVGDALYQRERRQRRRAKLLDEAAPDRRCSACGAGPLEGHKLIVVRGEGGNKRAVCIGCKRTCPELARLRAITRR